jgi:KDO2-lipid IV(A) lauroyltransferase
LPNTKQHPIPSALSIAGSLKTRQVRRLARRLGDLWFYLDGRHRRIAMANLCLAFGKELSAVDRKRIARGTFRNLAMIPFEMGWSLCCTRAENLAHLKVRGRSHLDRALRDRKGALILTAHMGNWEMLSAVVGAFHTPVHIVYRPLDNTFLDHFVRRFRTRFDARLIPRGDGLRSMIRALRQREIVALLMDQNVGWRKGVFVDFFGTRACTHKVLALLALKTGAPVIPLFMHREDGRLVAEFQAVLPTRVTGDRTDDLEWNTRRYNQVIEAFIRRYPDQWLWLHRRWKTRPHCPWPKSGRWARQA